MNVNGVFNLLQGYHIHGTFGGDFNLAVGEFGFDHRIKVTVNTSLLPIV